MCERAFTPGLVDGVMFADDRPRKGDANTRRCHTQSYSPEAAPHRGRTLMSTAALLRLRTITHWQSLHYGLFVTNNFVAQIEQSVRYVSTSPDDNSSDKMTFDLHIWRGDSPEPY